MEPQQRPRKSDIWGDAAKPPGGISAHGGFWWLGRNLLQGEVKELTRSSIYAWHGGDR